MAALERAVQYEPDSLLLRLELADAYERLALGAASPAIADDGTMPLVAALTADARALGLWRSIGLGADQFVARGVALERTGDSEGARRWWQRAIALDPGYSAPWYRIGVSLMRSGSWPLARDILGRAAGLEMRATPSSDVLTALGSTYHQSPPEQRDLVRAAQIYGEALRRDDFSSDVARSDAWYLRGHAYDLLGRPADALTQYERAVALHPDSRWAQLRLGTSLYRNGHGLAAAVAALERALTLWPADSTRVFPLLALATTYNEAGQDALAAAAYRDVLQIDPNNQNAASALAALEE